MKRKFRFLLGVMLVLVVFPGLFSGCTRWKKPMTELEIKQAYLDSGTIKGTTIEDLTVNYVAEFDHASVVHMVNVKVEQWILTTVNDLGGTMCISIRNHRTNCMYAMAAAFTPCAKQRRKGY